MLFWGSVILTCSYFPSCYPPSSQHFPSIFPAFSQHFPSISWDLHRGTHRAPSGGRSHSKDGNATQVFEALLHTSEGMVVSGRRATWSVQRSIDLSIYLSIHLFIYLSIYLSICRSIDRSKLSIHPSYPSYPSYPKIIYIYIYGTPPVPTF